MTKNLSDFRATTRASGLGVGCFSFCVRQSWQQRLCLVPIAAICFAWNAFKVLFGGERGMEQAKKNILIIVIVLALVFLAPPIIKEVGGWFGTGHWSEL